MTGILSTVFTPGCGTAVAVAAGGHIIVDILSYFAVLVLGVKWGKRCSHSHSWRDILPWRKAKVAQKQSVDDMSLIEDYRQSILKSSNLRELARRFPSDGYVAEREEAAQAEHTNFHRLLAKLKETH